MKASTLYHIPGDPCGEPPGGEFLFYYPKQTTIRVVNGYKQQARIVKQSQSDWFSYNI